MDEDGLLIGYASELAQSVAFADAMQHIPRYLLQEASEEEVSMIQNNAAKLAEIPILVYHGNLAKKVESFSFVKW